MNAHVAKVSLEAEHMRLAVALARKSVAEDAEPRPLVGALFVRDGVVLAEGFRGKTGSGDHAEYSAMKTYGFGDLTGSTLYTTLEPCTERQPPKQSCAARLIEAGVAEVYIGMYDPNPVVYRRGWRTLHAAGITLWDFRSELRASIKHDNAAFIDSFRSSRGDQGNCRFDYTLNDGNFDVHASAGVYKTHWTPANAGSIWAYGVDHPAASARYATSFGDVHDPSALDFSTGGIGLRVGDICVFRGDGGYLLVKITEIELRRDGYKALGFDYEVRLLQH
jgi:diaminohydroxyphosphoribosylaminopyrimidine deaminase/5-amino-6-(5-phosphoribosylamino)uracil reductase